MDNSLPRDVQMQFMRPAQLERALRAFPAVYVPFGLIEWHGRHLPLGNDALKAHAFLVKVAEQYGGVVYPPVFFPSAAMADGTLKEEELRWKVPMVTALFERLKATGCRVIIGVSGHDIREQLEMIRRGLEPVTADGTVAGDALFAGQPVVTADLRAERLSRPGVRLKSRQRPGPLRARRQRFPGAMPPCRASSGKVSAAGRELLRMP